LGLGGFAGHAFAGHPAFSAGLYGSTNWYRNYLAVTGACMLMRREVFEDLGGFDEEFLLCGSDVELCLKAWNRATG
jgi:GT2 family glycosyltransferase